MDRDMLSEVKDAFRPYFSVLEIQLSTVQRLWRGQVDLFNDSISVGTRQMDRVWESRDPIGLLGVPIILAQELSERCGEAVMYQWDSLIDASKTLNGFSPVPSRRDN